MFYYKTKEIGKEIWEGERKVMNMRCWDVVPLLEYLDAKQRK